LLIRSYAGKVRSMPSYALSYRYNLAAVPSHSDAIAKSPSRKAPALMAACLSTRSQVHSRPLWRRSALLTDLSAVAQMQPDRLT
jgi:hypothetical protein